MRTLNPIHPSWHTPLTDEFETPYMQELQRFLAQERDAEKVIYPQESDIYKALNATPFDLVKVVILGQDPYHGEGQAHGLSFSVAKGVKIPPSLRNIYKELHRDLHISAPSHGCLQGWAQQGVLLLNATLTVEASKAGSHQGKGWEYFTDAVIQALNMHQQHVVFMLWGSYAQKKGKMLDRNRHCVLESAHPSPLSAYRGFLGNGHFSAANGYLKQHNKPPIDWSV